MSSNYNCDEKQKLCANKGSLYGGNKQNLCGLAQIALDTQKMHGMVESGDKVIVACSGGADSMALLHFFHSHKEKLEIDVLAAHVNHNLRASASDGDELFVREFCEKAGIQLFVKQLSFTKAPSENECRIKRYEFFEELLAQQNGTKIATAHTENDNAETILLHITRGAGLFGLCGILPVRGKIIRPLLNVSRLEIEQYLKQHNINYRQDGTNFEDIYARNKVRLNAMPELRKINENVSASLLRLAKTAGETNDYMLIQADELLKSAAIKNSLGELGYSAEMLASAHVAVLKTALHVLITPYADADTKKIELAHSAVKNGTGSVELSKTATFTAAQNFVRIIKNNNISAKNEQNVKEELQQSLTLAQLISLGSVKLKSGCIITAQIINYEKTVNFKKNEKKDLKNLADYGKIKCNSIFRAKKQGDTFKKAHSNITKPLKKVYSEAKLSAHMREANPVLVSENSGEIIWAAGFGFSHNYLPSANTEQCLLLHVEYL